jgi:iodotyrosine deiodinase
MKTPAYTPYSQYRPYSEQEMLLRARTFHEVMKRRRTVRDFSDKPVALEVIKDCIAAAGTAPSGANQQPWHFVIVQDPEIKAKIRVAAEEEEQEFYQNRAPKEWLDALAHLGTDEHKSYLETAPYLIVIFQQRYSFNDEGARIKHYYTAESVGIATGILITALHNAGLASLTHTPAPMDFLNEILDRPENEKPFMILVAGYPAEDCGVPVIEKKMLDEIMTVS